MGGDLDGSMDQKRKRKPLDKNQAFIEFKYQGDGKT
jgi:hypothetical protein